MIKKSVQMILSTGYNLSVFHEISELLDSSLSISIKKLE